MIWETKIGEKKSGLESMPLGNFRSINYHVIWDKARDDCWL